MRETHIQMGFDGRRNLQVLWSFGLMRGMLKGYVGSLVGQVTLLVCEMLLTEVWWMKSEKYALLTNYARC